MKKLNFLFLFPFLTLFVIFPHFASAQTTAQAIDLDGVDDWINVPTASNDTREAYTIQTRVKLTGSIANQGIILGTYNGSTTNWSHQIRTDASGHFMHYMYDQGDATHTYATRYIYGTTVAVPGQWYDITITAKDGGFMRLYVNGVEEGTAQPVGVSWKGVSGYLAGLSGGNANSPGSEVTYLKGQFDEIRIWTTQLTPAQINQYSTCSVLGNYGGLGHCYSFNEKIAGGDNRANGYVYDQSTNNSPAYFYGELNGATSNFVAPGGTLVDICSLASISITGRPGYGNITNGSTTPDTYYGTDYETVYQNYPLTRNFVMTNSGTADLAISSVTITGANASDFTITTQPATTLVGGQTTTLGIKFTPGATGARRATVTINSNATGANAFTFVIGGNGGGILPLTLTRFSAAIKQQAVALNWETVNEQSTSRFEVERSADGRMYTTLATVNAAGTSRNTQTYTAQDNTPEKGISYYRLKMIDLDGKFTYSSVVKVDLSSAIATAVSIAPNPVQDNAQVTITSKASGKATLKLLNLTGQPVQQYPVIITNGQAQLKMERKGLAAGTYFYTLTNEQGIMANGKVLFQ